MPVFILRPGELTVSCSSVSDRPAFCELRDHLDGTFTLSVKAQDVGRHFLTVKYNDDDVPGKKFDFVGLNAVIDFPQSMD